jgi:hypothetical protein
MCGKGVKIKIITFNAFQLAEAQPDHLFRFAGNPHWIAVGFQGNLIRQSHIFLHSRIR